MARTPEEYFWHVLESQVHYEIPAFIKNGFNWLHYGNPISFKEVTDSDIDSVQDYIRNHALVKVADQLEESIDINCEAPLEHNELIQIFGKDFASKPLEFQFRPGDIALIRSLVTYVKEKVDGNGMLTGIAQYVMQKKKGNNKNLISIAKPNPNYARQIHVAKAAKKNQQPTTTQSIEDLKFSLFQRVKTSLQSYNIDTTDLKIDTVEVEPNCNYGTVKCVLCQDDPKKKSKKPKRVFFNSGKKKYWVISNFEKHLDTHFAVRSDEKIKKFQTTETNKKSQCNIKIDSECNNNDPAYKLQSNLIVENNMNVRSIGTKYNEQVINCDDSLQYVGTEIYFDVKTGQQIETSENISIPFFDQISSQITEMVGVVLTYTEEQEQMEFSLDNTLAGSLSVVKADIDGNCLFSALAHQLYHYPMKSSEHVKKTNELRDMVVEHILHPNNFHSFERYLKDRVYSIKTKKQIAAITDISTECKMFVRHVLSKNGQWGGSETIKAVSDIHQTNILIFRENGPCYRIQGCNQTFNSSILIAYRLGLNEQEKLVFNHYDSVTDMDSEIISATADILTKK